jgi:uncharacterized glyoxalase superfamily protein PhnB
VYADGERAIEWLTQAFVFELALSVPSEGGGVFHPKLHTPDDDTIMVLSTQRSTRRNRSPRSLGGPAQSVYVATRDSDSRHDRATVAGRTCPTDCATPTTAESSAAWITRVTSSATAADPDEAMCAGSVDHLTGPRGTSRRSCPSLRVDPDPELGGGRVVRLEPFAHRFRGRGEFR